MLEEVVNVVAEANPLFTVNASDFQPIIDTLQSVLTTLIPVSLSIIALWAGYNFVIKGTKKGTK